MLTAISQIRKTHRQQLLQSLINEIFELWGELGVSPTTDPSTDTGDHQLDLAILSHLGASLGHDEPVTALSACQETLSSLQAKKASLEATRDSRMSEIQTLYDELYLLWTRLGVSDDEADEFVDHWKGCEEKCIAAYKAELARMLQVKANNMAIFIAREREEIVAMWDTLFLSEAERANFPLMDSGMSAHGLSTTSLIADPSDMATEEVLLAHELEKQRLLEDRASKQAVLCRLAKYFEILDEIAQLEVCPFSIETLCQIETLCHCNADSFTQASANDPARLTGKGQRGDPGRLLREEKLRKRIAKEKPKVRCFECSTSYLFH